MMFRCLLPLAAFTCAALAQSPVEAVSVIATRSATLPADEAVFSAAVTTAADVPLERVVQALEGTGITADHLIQVTLSGEPLRPQPPPGVPLPPAGPGPLTYSFLISVPADALHEMTGKLAAIQRARPEGVGALTASGRLSGSPDRVEDVRNFLLPELVAEARRRADVYRQASGVTGNAIVSLGETSTLAGGVFGFATSGTGVIFPGLNLQSNFGLSMRVGQGGPRLLNVGATKSVTLPPDEATVAVTLVARRGSTQQQVLAALARVGFTASDIVSVNVQAQGPTGPLPPGAPAGAIESTTIYTLQMTRPAAQFRDLATRLAEVQILGSPQILTMQYAVGLTASAASIDAAREAAMPELLEQARSRAESLAAAAQVRLGAPVGLFDLPSAADGRSAAFTLGLISAVPGPPSVLRPSFGLSVQYALE